MSEGDFSRNLDFRSFFLVCEVMSLRAPAPKLLIYEVRFLQTFDYLLLDESFRVLAVMHCSVQLNFYLRG